MFAAAAKAKPRTNRPVNPSQPSPLPENEGHRDAGRGAVDERLHHHQVDDNHGQVARPVVVRNSSAVNTGANSTSVSSCRVRGARGDAEGERRRSCRRTGAGGPACKRPRLLRPRRPEAAIRRRSAGLRPAPRRYTAADGAEQTEAHSPPNTQWKNVTVTSTARAPVTRNSPTTTFERGVLPQVHLADVEQVGDGHQKCCRGDRDRQQAEKGRPRTIRPASSAQR